MENHWAIYDQFYFEPFQKKLGLYPENNPHIDDMYRNYYDLFPCDKFRELSHICLLLFFYYTKEINVTHGLLLDLLFDEQPYNAAVSFQDYIQKNKQKHEDTVDELKQMYRHYFHERLK